MLPPIQSTQTSNTQPSHATTSGPATPPQNAAHGMPEASLISQYLQAHPIALDKPVTGANIWGIGVSTQSGREYQLKRNGLRPQISGTTQSSSQQVNIRANGANRAARNSWSAERTDTGTTLTQTNTRALQTGNSLIVQQTQVQVTNEPPAPADSAEKKVDTAKQNGLAAASKKVYENTSLGLSWDAQNMPAGAVANHTFQGTAGPASGSVQISALGYDTNAGASVGLQGNAFHAEAHVGAEVYAAKLSASGQVNLPAGASLKADGTAEVGAAADGTTEAILDPLHGNMDGTVDASAFAGAKAQGDTSVDIGPADTTAKGDVGAGLGASVDASVGLEKGKLNFDFGLQAYLGIGGGGNISVSVNVGALAHDAGSVVKDVGGAASSLGHVASGAWHDATSWL